MHPNAQTIQKFYTAFQVLDAPGMCACYHPAIVFTDPAFGSLEGKRATAMWHMLCGRARDLNVTFSNVQASESAGSAHWEATYSFGEARRQVHNIIDAAFSFQDGLIIRHTDSFDLWKWAGMALGPLGLTLGWSPFVKAAIRRNALRGLEAYIEKQGSSGS